MTWILIIISFNSGHTPSRNPTFTPITVDSAETCNDLAQKIQQSLNDIDQIEVRYICQPNEFKEVEEDGIRRSRHQTKQ